MKFRRLIIVIGTLLILCVVTIAVLFIQWLDEQPDDVDFIVLVDSINDRRNSLSGLNCSVELISELEELLEDQELFMEQIDLDDRENYYFDLIMTHAKLGYIHELDNEIETSERHYSIAAVYGDLGSSEFGGVEYVKKLARESSIGCLP